MPILRIIYCATGIYSSVFAGVGTKTGFWIRIYRVQRDVAQFGRALRSGRKGRRFKSCHPDQGQKLCFSFFKIEKQSFYSHLIAGCRHKREICLLTAAKSGVPGTE